MHAGRDFSIFLFILRLTLSLKSLKFQYTPPNTMPNKYYEFMERTPCVPDACHDVILAGAAKNGTALLCYCFHFGSPVVWSAQAAAAAVAAAEAVPHNNVRGHTHKGVYVVYMGKKCLPLPPAHLGKSAIFLLRPRLCVCVCICSQPYSAFPFSRHLRLRYTYPRFPPVFGFSY